MAILPKNIVSYLVGLGHRNCGGTREDTKKIRKVSRYPVS
jgi:hypothetical protein